MEDNNNVKYDLTGKKIIPLNAPIGFANATPPTTLPFQAVEKGQSVSEGLCAGQGVPYYNEDGTINVNAVATNLKMMLDMYNTISQPVALLSMGAIPEWSQSVRDNNGGYPKNFVIREYDTTGYFVFYQSNVDNNMHDKPTLASHVGWDVIYYYALSPNGTTLYGIKDLEVVHAQGTSATFGSYTDATKGLVIGKLYAYNDKFLMEYRGQNSIELTSRDYEFEIGHDHLEVSLVSTTGYALASIQSLSVDYGFVSDIQDLGNLSTLIVLNTKLDISTSTAPVQSSAKLYITIKAQLA